MTLKLRALCAPIALALVATLVGCESTQSTNADGDAMSSSGSDSDAAVGRQQMEVSVSGADATAKDNTITLDYPVLLDRNDRIPDWVINPGIGGVLGAVGVAAPTRLGTKEQLNEARLNARLELAQMLEVRLQNVGRGQLEQQVRTVGEGLTEDSRKSILNVDRNISDIVLAGSRQRALWFDPENKEVFVWLVLDGKVLEMVDHYVTDDVSVFLANTAITSIYRPMRRTQEPPKVNIDVAQPPAPAPKPVEKDPIDELEDKMKPIETVPLKEDG